MTKPTPSSNPSSIVKFFRAFPFAFRGILSGFKERNMKFHGIAAVIVWLTGALIGLDRLEWFVIYILIALVWAAELFNTAIEELANIVRDEFDLDWQATKRARDTAAGAVLVLSIMAAFLGGGIFLVRLIELLC
ncbi:MAG: diacylglycerol kinase family protein [Candidatus Pacebacteria bacterium]|nr:diacylglycerol kinase family protein [Candidatus Paceibacterota bacterium]